MLRKALFVAVISALVGFLAVLTASTVLAQSSIKVHRIGILWAGTQDENVSRRAAFLQGLGELGWEEKRNISFEERWADSHYERLPGLAWELVKSKVEILVACDGTPSALAAMKATREIPIVVPAMGDPVANKIVPSLAHPGGNLTGTTNLTLELHSKRIAFLKEALPAVKHVALLLNGANQSSPGAQRQAEASARSLGIELKTYDVRDPKDFEKTIEQASNAGVQALLAGTDILFQGNMGTLGRLALDRRLPLVAGFYSSGVLIVYNVSIEESYRRAASYVDKILHGANPGDLPIEQPTRVHLIIDLKTAKALGITIPQSLLLRADEVIQ